VAPCARAIREPTPTPAAAKHVRRRQPVWPRPARSPRPVDRRGGWQHSVPCHPRQPIWCPPSTLRAHHALKRKHCGRHGRVAHHPDTRVQVHTCSRHTVAMQSREGSGAWSPGAARWRRRVGGGTAGGGGATGVGLAVSWQPAELQVRRQPRPTNSCQHAGWPGRLALLGTWRAARAGPGSAGRVLGLPLLASLSWGVLRAGTWQPHAPPTSATWP
jgi:hypothetical protein